MRSGIVVAGLVIGVFGVLLSLAGLTLVTIFFIALLNIIIGMITPRNPGVNLQPENLGPVKMIVDKAYSRNGTCELVFSDTKIVLKKLVSQGSVAVATALFAVIGGLIGGLTGWSLREYMIERNRNKIHKQDALMTVAKGDREIPYESISQVELTRRGLKMTVEGEPMVLRMAKKYPPLIASRLREIIPSQYWLSPVSTSP